MMNTILWWAVGILALIIALVCVVPSLYTRYARNREKQLSQRSKRRTKL